MSRNEAWQGCDFCEEPNLEEEEDGNTSHPYGWATYSVNVSDEGIHGFLGLKYQELKIQ